MLDLFVMLIGSSAGQDMVKPASQAAMALVTIMISIIITYVLLEYVKPLVRDLKNEKLVERQGVPIVPDKSLLYGHYYLEQDMSQRFASSPVNADDPNDTFARLSPFEGFCSRKYGKNFVYWLGNDAVFCTHDPDIVREVLVLKNQDFPRSSKLIKHLKSIFGVKGILTLNGNEWVQHRRIISQAFRLVKLKGMTGQMLLSVNSVVRKWEALMDQCGGSAEINVSPDLSFIAADVISRTSLGTTYEEGKRYFQILEDLLPQVLERQQSLLHNIPGFRWLPTALNRKIWKQEEDMKSILENVIIKTRRSCITNGGSYGNDLLGLMLEASEDEGAKHKITSIELMDELKVFFFAGQETTSNLLNWTIMLLGKHQDWQEKAYEEVKHSSNGHPLDSESLGKLKVMEMIFYEVLRLYPAAVRLIRQAQREVRLGDVRIPKGMTVSLNVAALHRDLDLWGSDPHSFNPQRFENGPTGAAKHPMAFLPFSAGPRHCAGQNLAWLEAKLALASILLKFKVRISPNYVHHPHVLLTPTPKQGVRVILSRREYSL